MSIDYFPSGMSMWDSWGIEHRGQAHILYLQFYGKNSHRDPADTDWLGHAVSNDLLHWHERPLAIGPGEKGGLEDMQPWTGSLVEKDGRFYLFYTMRSSTDGGYGQKIGLALSDDLEHWTRWAGNPVLVPDERWYIGYAHPLNHHTVDCRDMVVIPHPDGGWLGYFAARVKMNSAPQTAAIGLARSSDLLHWEQLPPAFVPGNISAIEVPDVYPIDGRWYLTCLTGNRYGNRGFFSDPTVRLGTIYAVAERPEGPFQMIPGDNVLLGGQAFSGYTLRTMAFEGQRCAFYTQPVPEGPATLSPPMALRTIEGGRLRLAFSERARALRRKTLIAPGQHPEITQMPFTQFYWALNGGGWQREGSRYRGEAPAGWQTADLGTGAEDFEFFATLTLLEGAAVGFTYRPDAAANHCGDDQHGDFVFYLDAEHSSIEAARLPAFDQRNTRQFPMERKRAYRLRLCKRGPRFELYVDDILVLQGALLPHAAPAPSVGLFVDRGTAEINDMELYALG